MCDPGTENASWLYRFTFYLQRARNCFDTLAVDESILGARSDLERALALLEIAEAAERDDRINGIDMFTYDERAFWDSQYRRPVLVFSSEEV